MKNYLLFLIIIYLLLASNEIFSQWMSTSLTEITPALAPKYDTAGTDLYAGTFRGIYNSSDSGANWDTLWAVQTDTLVYCLATANDWIFAGTKNGGLIRSSNNGQNWSLSSNGLPSFNIRGVEIVANNLGDTTLFAATFGGGIFKSTDFASNWLPANNGISNLYLFSFITLGNGTSDPQIFAASNGDGIYKSTDFGNSWFTSNNGLNHLDVRVFASNITSGVTNLFAGTHNGGMYLSTNEGDSWTQINNGVISNWIWALTSTPGDSSAPIVFAGSDLGGCYRTTNNGLLWEDYGPVDPNTNNYVFAINGDYILAGTQDGVLRRLIDETSDIINLNNNLPGVFTLNQNYPNPFNPSTTISFSIPNEEFVTLKVFNSLGEEVAELVNETKSAGNYSVSFNANNLSSGIYFYKITAGNFVEVKKMILIR